MRLTFFFDFRIFSLASCYRQRKMLSRSLRRPLPLSIFLFFHHLFFSLSFMTLSLLSLHFAMPTD